MTPDLTRRRSSLTAALGFALLDTRGRPAPPEVADRAEVAGQLG